MSGVLRPGHGGNLLAVRVSPKASRNLVSGFHRAPDGTMSLAVKVTAPADKGKANQAVIAVLADWCRIPKSALTLIAGETGRLKTVLVTGDTKHLEERISNLLDHGRIDGETH